MDEITQRRLIGAAALFVFAFAIAALLPDPEHSRGIPGREPAPDSDSAPQVVVYDLRTPPAQTGPGETPADPPPFKPVTPVLSLEPQSKSGASLGWFVQLGSYATSSSAKSALARAQQEGYNGTVQMTLKDKKKLYRARIGPFGSQEEAREAQESVADEGFSDARLIELWKP